MIFSKRLCNDSHVRDFLISSADERGWEVREEQDHQVIRRAWMHNWHAVEKAIMRFGLEAIQLQRAGWIVTT